MSEGCTEQMHRAARHMPEWPRRQDSFHRTASREPIHFHRGTLEQRPMEVARSQAPRNPPSQGLPQINAVADSSVRGIEAPSPKPSSLMERSRGNVKWLLWVSRSTPFCISGGYRSRLVSRRYHDTAVLLRRSRPFPSQRRRADGAIHAVPDPGPAACSPERRFVLPDAVVRGPNMPTLSVARSTAPLRRNEPASCCHFDSLFYLTLTRVCSS